MNKTMQAARFHGATKPLVLEEVPVPEIGPQDVLIEVKACGICGTDLHIAREGTIPTAKVPITLGHEIAGVVVAVGAEVRDWRAGDRVAVYPHEPCGNCSLCQSDREALCPQTKVLGLHLDGGFAQYLKIRADSLISLPEEIPFEQGAIITDAVSTAYHALTERGRLQPGETIAIFGCGGVGHQAIKLARLLQAAKIFAVDISEGALKRAKEAGADELINAQSQEPSRRVRELSDGEGVDLALEFVGRESTVTEALRSTKRGGRTVVVGVGPERVTLPPLQVFVGVEASLLGSMGFSRRDLREVVELVVSERLDLSGSVTEVLPLARINEALEHLEKRVRDPVRIVVVP